MIKFSVVAFVAAGIISSCDTAEERADRHYQSGLELLEQGDVDRALVEFRNVFQLNGTHREARLLYANAERERGNMREAFGQYLRLVEQYPDSAPGQTALAEMSLEMNDWEAARRHATAAAKLVPENLSVQSVLNTISYREALESNDVAAVQEAVTKAETLVAEDSDLMTPRRLIIDDLIRKQDWTAALSAIDAALAELPDDRQLYTVRLGVLNQLGETAEIRAQLEDMIERYPEDANLRGTLVRWYLSQGDDDAAEAFLLERANREERAIEDIVTYIRFVSQARDNKTAVAELEQILESDPPEIERLTALRASFRFEMGERDEAISEIEQVIESMEPSDVRRSVMVMQARMLEATGNNVGARALVEEILEEDGSQPEALKMRASWLIQNDRVDEAIVALRTVLGNASNDADAMTLLARAHERAGNRDLMADLLSRAVEASSNAPEESVRYAKHLLSEGNLRTAETVLINALRLVPDNVALLGELGEIYMREQDWPRLTQVIDSLRNQEDARAVRLANELQARLLSAQNREQELLGFLDGLVEDEEGGMGAAVASVRMRLSQGDAEGAEQYAREILEENSEDPTARLLMASVQAVSGDLETAETSLRNLTEDFPEASQPWMMLHSVLALQQRSQEARQAIQDGLEASQENLQLNLALAGILEREGDIEGAIEIYDRLYTANSNNLIIANNLASLLATGRADSESLDRAHGIARRLRDLDVPAFQDTYGWIAFRRGDLDSAVEALEPAAEGLPSDPMVQYHLARTYLALERDADALKQFRKVVDALEDGVRPDFIDEVEAEIDRLATSTGSTESQN